MYKFANRICLPDGTVCVVREGRTPNQMLDNMSTPLSEVGTELVSTLNRAVARRLEYLGAYEDDWNFDRSEYQTLSEYRTESAISLDTDTITQWLEASSKDPTGFYKELSFGKTGEKLEKLHWKASEESDGGAVDKS